MAAEDRRIERLAFTITAYLLLAIGSALIAAGVYFVASDYMGDTLFFIGVLMLVASFQRARQADECRAQPARIDGATDEMMWNAREAYRKVAPESAALLDTILPLERPPSQTERVSRMQVDLPAARGSGALAVGFDEPLPAPDTAHPAVRSAAAREAALYEARGIGRPVSKGEVIRYAREVCEWLDNDGPDSKCPAPAWHPYVS